MHLFINCISVPKMKNCSFHIFSLLVKNWTPKTLNITNHRTEQLLLLHFAIYYISPPHYVSPYKSCQLVSMLSARGLLHGFWEFFWFLWELQYARGHQHGEQFLLRCPTSSSALKSLPHLSTAATRSGRLTPPPAALPSLPIAGPVIVYGVCASVVYGLIYWITALFWP